MHPLPVHLLSVIWLEGLPICNSLHPYSVDVHACCIPACILTMHAGYAAVVFTSVLLSNVHPPSLHAGFAVVVVTSATVAATVLGAEIYEVTDTKVIATKEARVARSGAGEGEDARAREGAES